MTQPSDFGHELEALHAVLKALEPLEDDGRRFVLRSAAERFGISDYRSEIVRRDEFGSPAIELDPAALAAKSAAAPSLENFVFLKRTDIDAQRAAVLAFYLTKHRNQKLFKTADLSALNEEAAGRRFGNLTKVVNNATHRDEFFAMAGQGFKRLTPLGERVVEAIPNQENVKRILEEFKPRIRRKRPKKAAV